MATYDYYDVEIYESEMGVLSGRGWLTDNLVSAYFRYMEVDKYKDMKKTTLFMDATVTSYAVREDDVEDFADIFEESEIHKKQRIFFPMNDSDGLKANGGTHWTLLVFDRDRGSFFHYDSSKGSRNDANVKKLIKKLLPLLKLADADKCTLENVKSCPQQENSYDCGLFVCKFADVLAGGSSLRGVSQRDIPEIRRLLLREITTKGKK